MNLNAAKAMADARRLMTDGAFQQAAGVVSDAKNAVREEMQRRTSSSVETIIGQLVSGDPISADDIALIREWIVGDAKGYTQMENNFHEWLSEYERLEASLTVYENKDLSSDELIQLGGILEDATRISYDIASFLEHQERMKRFDSAMTDGLSGPERETLARVLADKLRTAHS